jgi:hypothetical protein
MLHLDFAVTDKNELKDAIQKATMLGAKLL